MERSSGEKPDDLEITSIGSLYRGPWDKKYWSSSRGKDRYPYPVGYIAIRTHGGNTYKMEIREGLKGPIFSVTSGDGGDSSNGQTPEIAWENFQKKIGPRVKIWQGKRFFSKIDGSELFGFRNQFVQRLLRELVANVDGVAERSLISHSFGNSASMLDHEIRVHDGHAYPSLLPFLGKQPSTGKRTRKHRNLAKSFIKEARVKRICCQDLLNGADGSTSKQLGDLCSLSRDSRRVHFQGKHMFSLKDAAVATAGNETPGPLCETHGKGIGFTASRKNTITSDDPCKAQVKVSDMTVESCLLSQAGDEIQLEADHIECSAEKDAISHVQRKFFQYDKSSNTDLQCEDTLLAQNDSGTQFVDLPRYLDVCVPDTCDTANDNSAGGPRLSYMESPCSMKNELVAATSMTSCDTANDLLPEEVLLPATCNPMDTFSKGIAMDSLSEANLSSSASDPSSQKIDLDLAGQELARSMMTFLLPRAVPLLKKTYVKRKSKHHSLENKCDPPFALSGANTAEESKSDHLNDIMCQGELVADMLIQGSEENFQEKMDVQQKLPVVDSTDIKVLPVTGSMNPDPFTSNGSLKNIKYVIPDSFEDDHCVNDITRENQLPPDIHEVYAAPSDGVQHNTDSKLQVKNAEEGKKISICPSNEGRSNGVLLPNGLEKGETLLADSCIDHIQPDKFNLLKEEFNGESKNGNEKMSCCKPSYVGSSGTDMPCLDPQVTHNSSQHFSVESAYNDHGKMNAKYMPGHGPIGSDKIEHFNKNSPNSCPVINNAGDDDVPKVIMNQSQTMFDSPAKSRQISSPPQLVSFGLHGATGSGYASINEQISNTYIRKVGFGPKENVMATLEGDSSLLSLSNAVPSTGEVSPDNQNAGRLPQLLHSSKYTIPLSESIIYRNFKNSNTLDIHFSHEVSDTNKNDQAQPTRKDGKISMLVVNEIKGDEQPHLDATENIPAFEGMLSNSAAVASQNQDLVENVTENMKLSNPVDPSFSHFENCVDAAGELSTPGEGHLLLQECSNDLYEQNRSLTCSDKRLPVKAAINNDCDDFSYTQLCRKSQSGGSLSKQDDSIKQLRSSMQLVGCYSHPCPILSILLSSKEEDLLICVLCGLPDSKLRKLFMYVIPLQEKMGNFPSFLGYTSLVLPISEGPQNRSIPFERCGLQFTPDRQSLIFVSSIKAPHCSEQNMNCLCSHCQSNCHKESSVEIVHIKFGYVSTVAKLTTTERVCGILVCEPNYLIAVQESGKLHVWIMNLSWSESSEEFMLPGFDCASSMPLELERIPNCNFLVVGHNGRGGFGLWDIVKRVIVAKFFSPGITTFRILPVGLFNWKNTDPVAAIFGEDDQMKKIIPTVDNSDPKIGEHPMLSSPEDMAVWLLVSAALSSDSQHQVDEPNISPIGWWRLALLAKNVVVMGSVLDPRASAVNASNNYGIIGTYDGFLNKWELSTGKKLAGLRPFECGGISSVAIDARSGAWAVAGDEGHLLVYAQPHRQL